MNAHFPRTKESNDWITLILSERFGHSWKLKEVKNGIALQCPGNLGSITFVAYCDHFNSTSSDFPCALWNPKAEGWDPVLEDVMPAPGTQGLPTPLIETCESGHLIHYDILGLMYWSLCRVEELGNTVLDNHDRFPATASHAYMHGYLDRPIVDEWLHILGQVIQRQWPSICLKQHQFKMHVSHDVDRPSRYGFANSRKLIRRMGGDLARGYIFDALRGPFIRSQTTKHLLRTDPYNTFEWIMDVSDSAGLTSAFYFICNHTSQRDGDYFLEHPAMRSLLKRIHSRGHEIGLHPSYNTYDDIDMIRYEANRLKNLCASEGIEQSTWGGRMHYLRWKHPFTLRAWSDAGMSYDSTLSFADHAGFRCGTCFEYPGFDVEQNKIVKLRIRPLVAMEASVLHKMYMGCTATEAMSVFRKLRNACQNVHGQFTLLWHNSEFRKPSMRQLYQRVLLENGATMQDNFSGVS